MPLRFAALALLLLASACDFAGSEASVVNTCGADSECVQGECDEGRCVGPADLEVVVEVVPPSGSTGAVRPPWRSVPFRFEGALTRDLELLPTVEVSGQVRWGERRVPAEIIFTEPPLPGLDAVRYRTTTFDTQAGDGSDYSIQLPTGSSFTVEVRPLPTPMGELGPAVRVLPPLVLPESLNTPTPEGIDELRWSDVDLRYPTTLEDACGAGRAEGCRLEGVVVSRQSDIDVPEEGLQVWLFEEETQKVVSSRAETDEAGAFALLVQPGAGSWSLVVAGGETRPLFPRTLVDPSRLTDALIQVPTAASVRYEGRVERASGDVLAGAVLRLTSDSVFDDSTGYVGEFEAQVTTDEQGKFSVDLLSGEYDVIITPSDVDLAVHSETVRVQAPATGEPVLRGQLFSVPARARLTGSVQTPDMQLLPSVSVLAIARNDPRAPSPVENIASRYNRSVDGEVYENGSFELRLDVGRYDLVIQPSEVSNYPWVVVPNYIVGSTGVSMPLTERYEVGVPAQINGVVTSASGDALGGAVVRVFGRPPGSEERLVELGTTQTDEDGFYELLLPTRRARQ